jgi:c-di-GMP-binding flagellar brake protein YcgR
MEGQTPTGRERRSYFRVQYPEDYRPTITIRAVEYKIIDICEGGIRFYNPDKTKLPGDIFQAVVVLHDQDVINIVGRIIRVGDEEAAMMMTIRGIPYRKIIAEQAYLRQSRLS